jgi:predicted AAA+ superfamily ATPase
LSEANEVTGAHLENVICTDLLAWRDTETTRPSIMYWRTSTGDEVDFVVEWKNRLLGIEVKATSNPGYNDAKGLRTFLQEYGKGALGGLLLYGGEETFWISEGVLAVPWWKII